MKKTLFALPLLLAASATSQGALIITGVFDGSLSGGVPKVVEVYATTSIADLSIYGLGVANNGGGTDGEEFSFPADTVAAGTHIYMATESVNFTSYFGFAPTYTTGTVSLNGDDAVELFKDGSVIDTFGDISTDGSGTAWDYLDGWAYRNDNTGPNGTTFTIANWAFSGINANDGETSNGSAANPFPIGSFTAIPEPATSLLGALGLLALLRRKR